MSKGYSIRIAEAITSADSDKLGVKLGRACLAQDIPVAQVSKALGVTRQTVYQWFIGEADPRGSICTAIEAYMKTLG